MPFAWVANYTRDPNLVPQNNMPVTTLMPVIWIGVIFFGRYLPYLGTE